MFSAAEIAGFQTTIRSALDASLPLERNTPGQDTTGHATESWASAGNVACNVSKASASLLTTYAGIIGSQRVVVLRVMQTDDVREGDRITYDSRKWLLHGVENAESYTWTNEFLAVTVA